MGIREHNYSHQWDRSSYNDVSSRPEPQPISEESIREMVEESIREIMGVPEDMIIPVKVKVEEIPKARIPHGKNLYRRKLRIRR